jgi:two-component system NtrC family sensor kinase
MFSLRTKLIISFILIVLIIGIISTIVGIYFIDEGVIKQAREQVGTALNSAREIYKREINSLNDLIRLTAERYYIKEFLIKNDLSSLSRELIKIQKREKIDILNLTDKNGRLIVRSGKTLLTGDDQSKCPIIKKVLTEKEVIGATTIIPKEEMEKESPELAQRAYIKFIPTPKARIVPETEIVSGLVIKAAAPLIDDNGNLLGVLYACKLLTRDYSIVDEVKETVFRKQTYEGKDMGTATIFQGDLRISTNVQNPDGSRAIGTRVSEEVYNQVVLKGEPWVERAFVVKDWYLSAYDPIRDIDNKIIGILYVGLLEKKFVDMKKQTIVIFLGISFLGVLIALVISYFLARDVTKSIGYLVQASKNLAKGDFGQRIEIKANNEMGELGKTFNLMIDAIKVRDDQLKKRAQEEIMKAERLAMIGRLASGVAHEINNPLGGILLFSCLVLEDPDIQGVSKENVEKIVKEATRCKKIVKGLLDFARQTKPETKPANLNEVLETTLSLIGKQSIFQNIKMEKILHPDLPFIDVDVAQIQQVFINIIMNAAEAMEGKGTLTIATRQSADANYVEMEFADTGCGIKPENMSKLFEPFFTTKEVGHGTGLGLAISYGIIEKHRGRLDVKSESGKGAIFTVCMPINR